MNNLLNSSKLFAKRNASTILTCIGGVGVIATSVMAVKATPKAIYILEQEKEEKGEDLTNLEKIIAVGPVYLPSVIVGASTIACIFGANVLNKRHQAALTSAYALVNSSYKDYRSKMEELYGEEVDAEVRDEIAKEKYGESDILGDGTELFYDEFSKRYFRSTIEAVQRAEYYINRDLVMRDYATVNEFYNWLDIPPIDSGDDLGWSTGMNQEYYWQMWIDFTHRKIVLEDGTECRTITMFQEPNLDFTEY